uniref:Uncharacterized protein n=1 Tax=Mimivirus LCMiAC01 TaxID=2506608 RepID=A0A481YZF3_9VIRU|nr:MAG: hypothetical protein LCMiAC01_02650 [Mimivirus LCMiAC01]
MLEGYITIEHILTSSTNDKIQAMISKITMNTTMEREDLEKRLRELQKMDCKGDKDILNRVAKKSEFILAKLNEIKRKELSMPIRSSLRRRTVHPNVTSIKRKRRSSPRRRYIHLKEKQNYINKINMKLKKKKNRMSAEKISPTREIDEFARISKNRMNEERTARVNEIKAYESMVNKNNQDISRMRKEIDDTIRVMQNMEKDIEAKYYYIAKINNVLKEKLGEFELFCRECTMFDQEDSISPFNNRQFSEKSLHSMDSFGSEADNIPTLKRRQFSEKSLHSMDSFGSEADNIPTLKRRKFSKKSSSEIDADADDVLQLSFIAPGRLTMDYQTDDEEDE